MRTPRKRHPADERPMAEINVTPLVDVVLVLLIIFMVTAPMLQMGIDVNLPQVKSRNVDVTEEKVVLTIDGAKGIFVNKTKIPLAELGARLEGVFADRSEREIYLRADRAVPYGFVVEVMAEIRKAGIDKLGMITEPPEGVK
jgi:biopolymer transport protein TolR